MPKKDSNPAISASTLLTYDSIIQELEGIERKGAKMPYTSLNGHMFSFLAADGSLALRLPKGSREEFMNKHATKLVEAHGAVLKEYVVVPEDVFNDPEEMKKYFTESRNYIKTLKPKPGSKSAAKK